MFWFIFMILIWFCYGWFYDFDMILIWFWYGWFFVLWLCHRNLMFSVTPTTTIPKAPSPIPSCAMVFFPWPFLSACVGPPAPTRATQHRKPTTANKHGTSLRPQQSHSQSWNMDGSDLKSQAQKNHHIAHISVSFIRVWLASSPLGHVGSFWEVLAHRSEKPEKGKKVRGSWLGCLWF